MSRTIQLRAGDTDPIELTIDATGLADLTTLTAALLYVRLREATTNEVDGATLIVPDTSLKTLRFDPLGAGPAAVDAFLVAGIYFAYVMATWTDGDETRHPSGAPLTVHVRANFE